MGPVIETAAQPGNNNIANVELIQTQSAPKWTLLSSLMELLLPILLSLFEQKRYQQY